MLHWTWGLLALVTLALQDRFKQLRQRFYRVQPFRLKISQKSRILSSSKPSALQKSQYFKTWLQKSQIGSPDNIDKNSNRKGQQFVTVRLFLVPLHSPATCDSLSQTEVATGHGSGISESTPPGFFAFLSDPDRDSVSREISDFTSCAHAQSDILHIKFAEKADDLGIGIRVKGKCVGLGFVLGWEKEK